MSLAAGFDAASHRRVVEDGAIAQLGERLHGMQEVGGSIPPGSTKLPLIVIAGSAIIGFRGRQRRIPSARADSDGPAAA